MIGSVQHQVTGCFIIDSYVDLKRIRDSLICQRGASIIEREKESCISYLRVIGGRQSVLKTLELKVVRSCFEDQHCCVHQVVQVVVQLGERRCVAREARQGV